MDTAFVVSEIIFNISISVAILIGGMLAGLVLYRLIRILFELESLVRRCNRISGELHEWIAESGETLSRIPLLSYFFKKRSPPRTRKVKETS